MAERLHLGGAGVLEQGAGGGDGQWQIFGSEAGEVARAEVCRQVALCRCVVEVPVGQALDAGVAAGQGVARAVRHQQLGRPQALELVGQGGGSGFEQAEVAAGQIEPGQAHFVAGAALDGDGQQQAVALFVEQRRIGQRARRDDARDGALDRSLARGRVADLLADRHRLAELDQARQVLLDRVVRHAGHRNRSRRPTGRAR